MTEPCDQGRGDFKRNRGTTWTAELRLRVGFYADLDESAGRHVPAARAGLSRLLTDVRLGLYGNDSGGTGRLKIHRLNP